MISKSSAMPARDVNATSLLAMEIAEALAPLVAAQVAEQVGALLRTAQPSGQPSKAAWLSTREVATQLGVAETTVRTWIRTGFLPARALGPGGRRYAVGQDDLREAVDRGLRPANDAAVDINELAAAIARGRAKRTPLRGK